LELVSLLQGTANRDGSGLALLGTRELNGHQPRLAVVVVRLDDQIHDTALRWIDDDIRELPKGAVRAVHGSAEFQTHDVPPVV